MNRNDQQFMAQKIRTQYMEKTPSELDALRELDAKVKRPANVFAYVFGSISAVVMGAGMSLVMTDIGAAIGITSALIPGIAIGALGLGMTLLTYPMYKGILNSRKKKYGAEILKLSDKIMNAKKSWDDAHMSPAERTAKMREENAARIADAKARTEAANARYDAAKKK